MSLLLYPIWGLLPGLELGRVRKYDVVNTHFAVPSGPLGVALSRLLGVPNVVSVHGGDVYDPTKRLSPHRFPPVGRVVKAVLRAADMVVAQSADTASNVSTYYGRGLRSKLRVVPLAYEPPAESWRAGGTARARSELNLAKDAYYIVSVGRMVERKGYDRLMLSLLQLPDCVRLLLVGDGPLEGRLRALARENGLAGRVVFARRVAEREKYRYLAAADCYVLSSHHEGFGIVLQEAMWAGLPVAATSHGGQRDLLTDGENALLMESNEPRAIAAAVQVLMGSPELSRSLAANGRSRLKAYVAEEIAERYIELFRGVGASR
jgi:glycosyltransferase involved in cell wall biosynthesis